MSARDIAEALTAAKRKVERGHVAIQQPIKISDCTTFRFTCIPRSKSKVTVNVARSPEQAERQAKGEDFVGPRERPRWTTSDWKLARALAEAGPNASFEQ